MGSKDNQTVEVWYSLEIGGTTFHMGFYDRGWVLVVDLLGTRPFETHVTRSVSVVRHSVRGLGRFQLHVNDAFQRYHFVLVCVVVW